VAEDHLNILTWNINRRSAESLAPLAMLDPKPGIVTLQEVTVGQEPAIIRALESMGYSAVSSCDAAADEKRYGNIVAVLGPEPTVIDPQPNLPWPQLVLHVHAVTSIGTLPVVTVHIPNGSGNGWGKIEALEVLRVLVEGCSGQPLILTGDFNEPRHAWQEERVVTFGHERVGGRWEVESGDWTDEAGKTRVWADWDSAVRWFFESDQRSRLHNAYWDAHGEGSMEESHRCHGAPRWFDHVFASPDLAVRSCDFLHTWRNDGLSDHSPLLATVAHTPD
jgi:endonuclease/exonuclease/phosphatase family metal-dependent hydrolase